MRKIDMVAAAIAVCGAGILHSTPASATYYVPDGKIFQYCCRSADAVCCSFRGCEISSSGCTRLQ
jgi:hypothetical protein